MIDINESISGFVLINKEKIDDIGSEGYIFIHKKSGARLMYIENNDDNKVFFISFKTPPEDDCGTPHIIEHSVLCGSEKYPVKDPFNELAKGSLNTYLNALTYSDKTVYPVASRNDKDFANLMDVYLDAVFNPMILKHKEIFMQEGHHFHMEKTDAPLEIKGVVYNEMKGAFSDPDRYLDGAINTALFTDSPYKFESGGDPDKIPDLTYDKFIEFYKKNYHPSNSYIYLFGKMDIEAKLEYLDKEYLSKFEKQNFNNDIKAQESQNKIIRKEEYYPVIENNENEAMYAASFITGKSYDEETSLGYSILSYILMDTNASPVRKALTEGGFCSDTEGWFDSSVMDTVFSIIAKGAKENSLEEFEKIIVSELSYIAENGLDIELVNSAVNAFEFMLSEENFGYKPRGLYYGLKAMNSWLHRDNPFESFRFKKQISSIRSKVNDGYFENLIINGMINNKTAAYISLQPKQGMQSEIDEAENKKLVSIKNSLSNTEREKIVNDTVNLLKFQSAYDDLSVMPSLKLSDISAKADIINNDIADGLFYVSGNTNDVIYVELLFGTNNIAENDYPYVGLLSDIIGRLDTEKYDFNELPTKIDLYTGGITSSCSSYYTIDGKVKKVLNVGVKALSRNTEMMKELIDQTTNKLKFEKTESIKLIIKDRILKLENYLNSNGHITAANRALSYFNEGYSYKDKTSGIDYFKFLCCLEKNFNEDTVKKLNNIADIIFSKDNLTVGISCENSDFNKIKDIENVFDTKNIDYATDIIKKTGALSEGIITSSKIQYVAKAADYKMAGYNYSGKLMVLKNILDLEYLWNTVRVQGGAYGCGCNFLRSGGMYMYSYRDPNLRKTLNIYDAAGKFLDKFNADEKSMTNYIIGAINNIDRPLNMEQKLKTAFARYITGISPEFQQKEREDILSATSTDIKNYSSMLENLANSPYVCVIGNSDNINNERILFNSVISMK